MNKTFIIICSFLFFLLTLPFFTFAEEEITITTYYPSPYGSYNELDTRTLWFGEERNGLIGFNYPDTNYDRRLRITAGRNDTQNNDQGASIDLHGRDFPGMPGELHLVAGRGRDIVFFTSPVGINATERIRINAAGAITGICRRVFYTATSGWCQCGDWNCDGDCTDSGESCTSYLSFVPALGAAYPRSGSYLCCEAGQ